MNKKLLSLFIVVGALALASCDAKHVHTFDMESFEKNEISHWHKATCEHTDLVKDLGEHTFNSDGECTVCGYKKEAQYYSFLLRSDYCELDNENIYEEGEEVELSLTIKDEFKASSTLPENIEVYSKGVLLTNGTDYTYAIEGEAGKLSLTVKGDIVVIAFKDKNPDSFKITEAQFADAMNVSDETHLQYNLTAGFYSSFSIIMQQYDVEYSPNVTYRGSYSFDASRSGGSINCDYTYIEKENEAYTEYHSDKSGVWTTRPTDEAAFNGSKSLSLGWFPFISGFQLTYDRIKDNFNSATNAYEVYFTYQEYDVKFEATFYNGKLIDISYEGTYEADRGIFGNITVSYLEKDVSIPNEAKPNYYSVIWKNYDGSILEIAYKVKEGTIPTCGTTPVKEDGAHFFNFVGWDPEVAPIKENMVYTAKFEQDMTKHLVIFKDDLGNELNRQFVTVGDEPDMTNINQKGFVSGNKVKVFTGWDKPVGKIYEDTTFVGSYETCNKEYSYQDIHAMISAEGLGDNVSYDVYYYVNNTLSTITHTSIADGKYKQILEHSETNSLYGDVLEMYMDQDFRYQYAVNDGNESALISANPNWAWQRNYDVSAFNYDTANYIYDEDSGLFVSDGSTNKVSMMLRNGRVSYMKREMKQNMDGNGVASTYDELYIRNIGDVEPFDIPEHDYEGVPKHTITFKGKEGVTLSEQSLYDGSTPVPPVEPYPEIEVLDDKIVEFIGWDKEIAKVSEDTTYNATFIEYKKTYTYEEIKEYFTTSVIGNNASFDYTLCDDGVNMWTKHVAFANGIYRNISEYYPENVGNYGKISEEYYDGSFCYMHSASNDQNHNYRKDNNTMSIDDILLYDMNKFFTKQNYVYDESLGLYVSEGDNVHVTLEFKNGKIYRAEAYLLNFQKDHYILQFTSYGGVEPFSVPDLPWSDAH